MPSIHLFGADALPAVWSGAPIARLDPRRSPASEDLAALLADLPATLAAAGLVTPADLSTATTSADVIVFVADATVDGQADPDLVVPLWNDAPALAVLLHTSVLAVGAVTFTAEVPKETHNPSARPGDPVTAAVAAIALSGGRLQAVIGPDRSKKTLPSNPPALIPAPKAEGRWLVDLLGGVDGPSLIPNVRSRVDATAIRAGLLLWHGFLDESHTLSQSIEGAGRRAGDYWHAIMHRREEDYSNSKYWFRQVGRHPVFETLATRAARLATNSDDRGQRLLRRLIPGDVWNPAAFVDACADVAATYDAETDLLLRRLQADEIMLLLRQTYRDAVA